MLVWVMVSVAYYGQVVYSPPMADLASCQRVMSAATVTQTHVCKKQCVQIRVPEKS